MKWWQAVPSNINTSKFYFIIAVILLVFGALTIYYSIDAFLTGLNQTETPPVHGLQWSGYIVSSNINDRLPIVSNISASWIVPEIEPSENDTFSGVWVGIGGYGEETLIQIGTEQEHINGKTAYYAWYELLPDSLIRIPSLHIRPSDMISASISLTNENASRWLIKISDDTQGEYFERVVFYNSSRLSAEWIVERPKVNGVTSTLANFGDITFTNCTATLGNITGSISSFPYTQIVTHEDQNPLVAVSSLREDGLSFTVSYLEPTSIAIQMASLIYAYTRLVEMLQMDQRQTKIIIFSAN